MLTSRFTSRLVLVSALVSGCVGECGEGDDDAAAAHPRSAGGTGGQNARAGAGLGGATHDPSGGRPRGGSGGAAGRRVDEEPGGEGGVPETGQSGGRVGGAGRAPSAGVGGSLGHAGATAMGAGEGGAAGEAPDGPGTLSGPRDKTVVEGMPFSFAVTSSGPAKHYEWQHSTGLAFDAIPDLDGSVFESPSSVLSDDGSHYRVLVTGSLGTVTSRVAALHVLPLASAALVALTSGSDHVEDHATVSFTSDTYTGSADLATGVLHAAAMTPDSQTSSQTYLSISFYNNTGATITIPDGSISLHFSAAYAPNSAASTTTCESSVNVNAYPYAVAGVVHEASVIFVDGYPGASAHTISPGATNAHVDVISDTVAGVEANLVLGAFDVPASQSIWLSVSGTAGSYFSSTVLGPITLTFVLPPGVELDSNAVVPLDWAHE